jgi:peptidoglycan hydrolase CwlO-like protein
MRKFIVALVLAACLSGPAGAASIVHTPSATTGTTYAHDATNNLPYQVNELRSEVKALQGQVSALQNTNMEPNDESDAQLWPVGTGG